MGVPLGWWVELMESECVECMGNSIVVEVLGDMVGLVSECVFNGFT